MFKFVSQIIYMQDQPQNQINIEISEEVAEGSYANLAIITHSHAEFVVDFVEKTRALAEDIRPSFFELTVAMSFDYFAHCKVDVAVIEVGLGGRLDSTNIITPELSIITNIGWHQTISIHAGKPFSRRDTTFIGDTHIGRIV